MFLAGPERPGRGCAPRPRRRPHLAVRPRTDDPGADLHRSHAPLPLLRPRRGGATLLDDPPSGGPRGHQAPMDGGGGGRVERPWWPGWGTSSLVTMASGSRWPGDLAAPAFPGGSRCQDFWYPGIHLAYELTGAVRQRDPDRRRLSRRSTWTLYVLDHRQATWILRRRAWTSDPGDRAVTGRCPRRRPARPAARALPARADVSPGMELERAGRGCRRQSGRPRRRTGDGTDRDGARHRGSARRRRTWWRALLARVALAGVATLLYLDVSRLQAPVRGMRAACDASGRREVELDKERKGCTTDRGSRRPILAAVEKRADGRRVRRARVQAGALLRITEPAINDAFA